jgi:hypothetical protein
MTTEPVRVGPDAIWSDEPIRALNAGGFRQSVVGSRRIVGHRKELATTATGVAYVKHDVRLHIGGVKLHHGQVDAVELNYERLEVVFDTGLTTLTYTADPAPAPPKRSPCSAAWRHDRSRAPPQRPELPSYLLRQRGPPAS